MRYISHPALLEECCRFLCMPPLEFISLNLPFTLPQLFIEENLKILARLGEKLNVTVATLFMNHSEVILARALMLSGQMQSDRAIAFIEKVLNDASTQRDIEARSIIRSCMVPLLATLVVPLGDEDPSIKDAVSLCHSL